MDSPKIRIESDGMRTVVYIDGKKIERCTSLDFHANVDNGIRVYWNGTTQKEDENGHLIIENDEIATEEFHYDSNEAVVN
jgi:hypothetical protein